MFCSNHVKVRVKDIKREYFDWQVELGCSSRALATDCSPAAATAGMVPSAKAEAKEATKLQRRPCHTRF